MANIKRRMNMDTLNVVHKEAAEEIIEILNDNSDLNTESLKEKIKIQFNLKEVPEKDVFKSVWYNMTKDFDEKRLGLSLQGWHHKTVDGQLIKVPFYGLNMDLDTLDDLVNHISQKVSNMK